MSETRRNKVTDLDAARQRIEQLRDEIRVQLHLMEADLRDEWKELEGRWEPWLGRLRRMRESAEETGEEVREDLGRVAADLKSGYERIRRQI